MKILLYDWYTDLTRLMIVDPILAIQLIGKCKTLTICATTNPGRLQPRRCHCLRSLGLPSAASTSRAHDPTRRPPAAASVPQTSLLTSDKDQRFDSPPTPRCESRLRRKPALSSPKCRLPHRPTARKRRPRVDAPTQTTQHPHDAHAPTTSHTTRPWTPRAWPSHFKRKRAAPAGRSVAGLELGAGDGGACA